MNQVIPEYKSFADYIKEVNSKIDVINETNEELDKIHKNYLETFNKIDLPEDVTQMIVLINSLVGSFVETVNAKIDAIKPMLLEDENEE